MTESMIAKSLAHALASSCDGPVEWDAPSSRWTTLRAGGATAALVEPRTVDSLRRLWRLCATEGVPRLVVGKGSNLLISDEGFPGVAFRLGQCLNGLEVQGQEIVAGAGAPLPAIGQTALKAELSGSEWCVGIPGTLGGAVFMNAGCHGWELADIAVEIESLTAEGEVVRRRAADAEFAVRTSCFQSNEELILGARLKLTPSSADRIRQQTEELLAYRKRTQPLSQPNCGSVFTNPPGHSAWKLIDDCGLRGLRCGGCAVSVKHSNFIVNLGDATARDIVTLIGMIQERVLESSGVRLAPELRIVGQPSSPRNSPAAAEAAVVAAPMEAARAHQP
ncbi:MAG: UDP-N-acetylmuramate dehydrogenase [Planctomyces sp.]|nr:UDP-N-acetylmuramate dehydrogenase [Planctomyces sp.]